MPSTRRLSSWLDGFNNYTKHMNNPPLLRKWAGVAAVSGALRRRCCLRTAKGLLAPNVFVLLVTPPGVGKSNIIDVVYDFWVKVEGLHVAPSSTTRAGLIDLLGDARDVDVSTQLPIISHSLLCASREFGNLVPMYDNAWLNILNDLYDCGPMFSDMTRKYGKLEMEKPHLCILAGTQPKYLENLLPDAAFGMGFTSRLMMVYAGRQPYVSLFDNINKSKQLEKYLLEDLQTIAKLQGEFFLTPEAVDAWEELAVQDFPPIPTHTKLLNYNARRPAHMLKAMMCFSAAGRDDLKIIPEHVEQAHKLLLDTERLMPEIFAEMVTKGYANANEEVLNYVWTQWGTNGKKPLQETALMKYLAGKVPNNQIKATIDLMVQSGQLQKHLITTGAVPYRAYTPVSKTKGIA